MTDAGHMRVGNRLYEAVVSAPFTEAQLRVVLTIIRLTLGWQRKTVIASNSELAQLCGYRKPSGGYRDAVQALVREGVVLLMSIGGGNQANAYAIQEDYEKWGKFSVSEARLESVWGKRPHHSDEQLPLRLMTVDRTPDHASVQAGSDVNPACVQAPPLPLYRQGPCLPTGRPPASVQAGSPDLSVDASVASGRGKTLKNRKDIEKPPSGGDRAEALELLTLVAELRERSTAPNSVGTHFIRLDRVKERFGADVAEAIKIIGGTGRLISTKPEHYGILAGDLTSALRRVRARPSEEATG